MAQSVDAAADGKRPATVLMARFSAFGDVAMTIPVIYSACRCYPEVKFVMVTRPSMTSMFVNPPSNLVLVGADVKKDYDGVAGIRRLCSELVGRFRPDVFADLHNVLRTNLMSFFFRLRGISSARIVKPRAKRRALTRARNKTMLPLVSQRARYREVFYKIGLPLTDRFDGLFARRGGAPAEKYASITAPKPAGEKWIGIAPFAAHPGKIYPVEKMETVVETLSRRGGIRVFLFGGGEHEKEVLGRWAATYPGVTSLAGERHGFAAELALMNQLDVMLSMDSANMHLAAIAGTRTVSIWGATHPYCGFKPWRQTDADMIQAPLACRPCSVFGDKPCRRGDYLCLSAISPELILEKLLQ